MAFAIISQVGDAVPLPIGLDAGVVSLRRRCLFQTDIGQIRILQADKVFELSVSGGSGESYLRGRLSLIPRPTHASHLALNLGRHAPRPSRPQSPLTSMLAVMVQAPVP
jgi:hypothetical protein